MRMAARVRLYHSLLFDIYSVIYLINKKIIVIIIIRIIIITIIVIIMVIINAIGKNSICEVYLHAHEHGRPCFWKVHFRL